MKTFIEFIGEDIEIVDVKQSPYQTKRKAADVHKDYGTKTYSSENIVKIKNHGEIHPGYELHQHTKEIRMDPRVAHRTSSGRILQHKFTIVHKASGDLAGEMHAWGGRLHPHKGHVHGNKGKSLSVSHLDIHPDHTSKKAGTSLPIAMYRHLHRKGHSIVSDSAQSHGGAHVWNTMRKDKELGKHMMIHQDGEPATGTRHSFSTRAGRVPDSHIWHQPSGSYSGKEKVRPHYGGRKGDTRLILSGKKRKKKTVKEDIEKVLASRLVIRPLKKS